jgi:FKBP-type peptidyl-prolyl cis-trans isomerase SlpA
MIKEGSKVKVHYTGKLEDNNVFDSSVEREPLEFVVGEGMLIPGFEQGLMGMQVGETKTIEIEPEQAYGEVREELINQVPKENLPEGVEEGQMLQANTESGPINVVVTQITEDMAVVDANHPLAGKKLIFDLEVVEVA